MKLHKRAALIILSAVCIFPLHAFNSGLRLGLKANLTGSLTRPKISKKDMAYLGGDGMKGMLGYITTGEADLTYLFDSIKYFRCQDNAVFGGLGWSFVLGLGQGFSGQISGSYNDTLKKQINVFCRVHMSPVLSFGSGIRSYFLRNRLALGGTVNIRMPLDPQPIYELYTNLTPTEVEEIKKNTGADPIDFSNETGTLQITEDQIKKINPFGYTFKGFIEYNQPFITNMELMLGAFLSYTIYKPKYVTMPAKLIHAAEKQGAKNVTGTPINSFYMNSLDFGISVGLNFKV